MSKKCANKTVLVFGVLELVLSLALLGCGTAEFALNTRMKNFGHGIWGGALLSTTSAFAIAAGCTKKTGLHITHMVFAILSCAVIIPAVKFFFYAEVTENVSYLCWQCRYDHEVNGFYGSSDANRYEISSYEECNYACNPNLEGLINGMVALGLCAILFIIMIISASFTCCAVCSCCGANVANGAVYPNQQESIVVYNQPMQQQPQLPVQNQAPHPNAYFAAAPNTTYGPTQMKRLPPMPSQDPNQGSIAPPIYTHENFSAALDGHIGFQPTIARPTNAENYV